MTDYDPAADGKACYDLAIASIREKAIRAGGMWMSDGTWLNPQPQTETEKRWRREGPVPNSELETVRDG